MANTRPPKVAIVYDRVNTRFGGAENVLQCLHNVYPDAPLFTSVYDEEKAVWAKSFVVKPTFLQSFPFARTHHRQYVAAMPLAFESLQLDEFDIVISVTSAEAKGVLTKPHQLHVCYLLTPTRYLWSHSDEYQQGLLEIIKQPIFAYLKWWDLPAAKRPDVLIPISERVAERCTQYYHRQTEAVIYPPVQLAQTEHNTADFPQDLRNEGIEEYYLVVSRLVGYKKIDQAIRACQKLGRNLVIIGDGPDREKLQDLVGSQSSQARILFLKSVQSDLLTAYYKNCRAFLAPGEEDFGIAALESHLFGKPAVLHQKSGSAEISQNGVASIHVSSSETEHVVQAIEKVEQQKWDSSKIQKIVAQYNNETFEKTFASRIDEVWQKFCRQLDTA